MLLWQVKILVLTGSLFSGPLFLTFCFLNTVALAYNSTAALPFGTIVVIFLIWTLVTSPLLVLGGIAGKNSRSEFQAPCRTTKYPRDIPQLPWYRTTLAQMAMAGFLPFSAIYIELYYIFASVWGHQIYTIYSILFIVFIILLIVTAFVTVALTYFQLAAEDHQWWWRYVKCTTECSPYFHLFIHQNLGYKKKNSVLQEYVVCTPSIQTQTPNIYDWESLDNFFNKHLSYEFFN